MPLQPGTIQILTSTPTVVRALLDGLPADVLNAAPEGEWSPATIAAHLVDRGAIQRGRVETLLATPGAPIADSDERESLDASGLLALPLAAILDMFDAQRSADVERYAALEAPQFAITGQHSAIGTITVEQLIHQAAFHDLVHLRQITTRLMTIHADVRGGFDRFD